MLKKQPAALAEPALSLNKWVQPGRKTLSQKREGVFIFPTIGNPFEWKTLHPDHDTLKTHSA